MLKKTLTFEDFNGEEIAEDFYFHLSKAELIKMELSEKGGLTEAFKEIVETNDGSRIMDIFENLILSSYGKKSEDGRRFIKNDDIRDSFAQSEAYSVLFMELVTDAKAAADFFNGIIPSGLAEEAKKTMDGEGISEDMTKEELLKKLNELSSKK